MKKRDIDKSVFGVGCAANKLKTDYSFAGFMCFTF